MKKPRVDRKGQQEANESSLQILSFLSPVTVSAAGADFLLHITYRVIFAVIPSTNPEHRSDKQTRCSIQRWTDGRVEGRQFVF